MPYMCNLYSETKGQAAIRALFRTAHDRTGNLPTFPGIPKLVRAIGTMDARGQNEPRAWGLRRGALSVPGFCSRQPRHLNLLSFSKARQLDHEKGRPKATF